ncbi:hypothetical protein Tco_1503286 [Tanacetum coccineum]
MSFITTQPTKLNLELIRKEKRLDIGKCNERLNPRKIQREPTFQVVLDALALTPCYSAFLITTDTKGRDSNSTLEVFRDIFKICPIVEGQDFEEIVSFLRDLGHTGEIHSLNDVVVDQMHQPWRTFATLINRSLSGKTTGATPPKKARKFKKPASPKLTTVPVSTKETKGKSKRVKRPAKKSTQAPTRGVVIRETLEVPVSKKKEKVEVARGKELELLSDVSLKEDAQFKEVRRKSMRD